MEARWMVKGMAHSMVVSIETTSFSLSKMFNPALMFSWCLAYTFSAEKESWVTFFPAFKSHLKQKEVQA